MTYWIIFEGHNKSGKSTILFSILDWLKKNNVHFKYANDAGSIDLVMPT